MSSRTLLLALLTLPAIPSPSASAQCAKPPKAAALPLQVNDETERYARILQDAGDAKLYPWSLRGFGWRESCNLIQGSDDDPWRRQLTSVGWALGQIRFDALPVSLNFVDNSAFPYGANDGAVWAGRGLTTSVSAGFAVMAGPVSLVVEPTAFRAENARFTMRPNGQTGVYAYGDAFGAPSIDQPQRFGDRAYQRLSPGNTTLRVDAAGVTFGFSTANQHWGPAVDNPLILGNNAEGYPHVFFGTSRPVNLGIARLHTRMHWGRLDSSPYSPAREAARYRFATGLVAVVQPKGIDGLELGIGRYFHLLWSDSVLTSANLSRPFIGLVRNSRIKQSGNSAGDEPDNQLASAFFRWVFPRDGIEFYGEFGKDDYNADLRDLTMEPDHISAYSLGLLRVIRRAADRYVAIRGEIFNARLSKLQLNRPQSPLYLHGAVPHGHTNLGQVLGAASGNGGGGAEIALDRYSRAGRTTLSWSRMFRQEFRAGLSNMPDPTRADLLEALTVSGVRLRGRTALTYELTGIRELNRFFAGDASNIRAAIGLTQAW